MMKRIIYFIVFFVFLIMAFHYLNKVFSTPHFYNRTIEDFKKLSKQQDIDVLFYGSSHVYTAFNPIVLNDEAKIVSYNLGSPAQRLPVTNLVFEESLKYTTPKIAIVEIYEPSLLYPSEKKIKGFQLRALDFVSNWSNEKMKIMLKIFNSRELLAGYFPLIRNHEKWGELDYLDLNRADTLDKNYFYYNGFLGRDHILEEDREKYKKFRTHKKEKITSNRSIASKDVRSIEQFKLVAEKHQIQVLVVTSPYLRANYEDTSFFQELTKLCNEFEVPYLNLNDYYEDINLDLNDFADPGHLNSYGAFKVSKFLAKYINENYNNQNSKYTLNKEEFEKRNEFYDKFGDNNSYEFSIKIDACLSDKLCLDNLKISRRGNDYLTTFKWKNHQLISENLTKYKLGVHIYPMESDIKLLSDYSQKKGFAFELADFRLDENGENAYVNFKSKLRNIKQIKLFLYDADGYKGILGNSILIDNIIFGQNSDFKKMNE